MTAVWATPLFTDDVGAAIDETRDYVLHAAIPFLVALGPRPAWMADAACLEHPDVNFFPDRGESTEPAKAICAGCLVREECLADALAGGYERQGIWGGTSSKSRKKLRERRATGGRTRAVTEAQHRTLLVFIGEHPTHARVELVRLWNDRHPERRFQSVHSFDWALRRAARRSTDRSELGLAR